MELEHEGFLWKKRPKKVMGIDTWQKRYFVLNGDSLLYFKENSDGAEVSGVIKLGTVSNIRLLLEEGKGRRFDVIVSGPTSREYCLRAESRQSALVWSEKISQAAQAAVAREIAKISGSQSAETRRSSTGRKSMVIVTSLDETGKSVQIELSPMKLRLFQLVVSQMRRESDETDPVLSVSVSSVRDKTKAIFCTEPSFIQDEEEVAGDEIVEEAGADLSQTVSSADSFPGSNALLSGAIEKMGSDHQVLLTLTEFVYPSRETPRSPVIKRLRKTSSDMCPMPSCAYARSRDQIYCEQHTEEFGAISIEPKVLPEDGLQIARVCALYRESSLEDKIDVLSAAFLSQDPMVHALAVRLLWALMESTEDSLLFGARFSSPSILGAESSSKSARNLLSTRRFRPGRIAVQTTQIERFFNFIQQNYNQDTCLSPSRDVLLNIVAPDCFEFHLFPGKPLASVSKPMSGKLAMKGLFSFLCISKADLRIETLEDVNMMLIGDEEMREWILSQKMWQEWISPLLKLDAMTFRLSGNLFSLLHFHAFVDKKSWKFTETIRGTLEALESSFLARALLLSFAHKLSSSKCIFQQSMDSTEWRNFLDFCSLVKDFIFICDSGREVLDEPSESKSPEPIIRLRSRSRSFTRGSMARDSSPLSIGKFRLGMHVTTKGARFRDFVCLSSFLGIPQDKELIEKVLSVLKSLGFGSSESDLAIVPMTTKEQCIYDQIREFHNAFADSALLVEMLSLRRRSLTPEDIQAIIKFTEAKGQKERRKVLASLGV